jgi:hypothetical protein
MNNYRHHHEKPRWVKVSYVIDVLSDDKNTLAKPLMTRQCWAMINGANHSSHVQVLVCWSNERSFRLKTIIVPPVPSYSRYAVILPDLPRLFSDWTKWLQNFCLYLLWQLSSAQFRHAVVVCTLNFEFIEVLVLPFTLHRGGWFCFQGVSVFQNSNGMNGLNILTAVINAEEGRWTRQSRTPRCIDG